ncbi:uncharacterized protein LOC142356294 isoform X2 [Convolutriloba macropyga]
MTEIVVHENYLLESNNDDNEVENVPQPQPFTVVAPEELSRSLSEAQNTSFGPNCSAIAGSQAAEPITEAGDVAPEQRPISSTPGNNKKLKRGKLLKPEDIAELKCKRPEREAAEAMKNAADKIMDAALLISNCMKELRPELKALSNRNYREIQISTNAVKQLTAEISKLGVLLPAAKSFPPSDKKLLEIPKGPGKGKDLALVSGSSPQMIGRNACKMLWTQEELKQHMLSPKSKQKQGTTSRIDFSPTRKEILKELFQIKYDERWVHMYELAKISLNNKGNEIKSNERRSLDPNQSPLEARNSMDAEKVVFDDEGDDQPHNELQGDQPSTPHYE